MEKINIYQLILLTITVQLLSVFFTYQVICANLEIPSYEPFGNATVTQATANSIPFIVGMVIFTVFLIILIKFGFRKIFTLIIIALPLFTVFVLTQFYVAVILYNLNFPNTLTDTISIFLQSQYMRV